jgi:hypothetical protein
MYSAGLEYVVLKKLSYRMAKKCCVRRRIGRRRRYMVFPKPGTDSVASGKNVVEIRKFVRIRKN